MPFNSTFYTAIYPKTSKTDITINESGSQVPTGRKDYKKAIEMYGKAVENGEKAGLEGIKNVYLKMGEDKSKL